MARGARFLKPLQISHNYIRKKISNLKKDGFYEIFTVDQLPKIIFAERQTFHESSCEG